MKTYIITPLRSKSFHLTTTYLDDNENEIKLEETYRFGSAMAELTESEVEILRNLDESSYFDLFHGTLEECGDMCYNDIQSDIEVDIDRLDEIYEEDDRLVTVFGPCEVTLYEE